MRFKINRKSALFLAFLAFLFFQSKENFACKLSDLLLQNLQDTLAFLNIPKRATNALTGSEFVKKVSGLKVEEREQQVINEILSGNVPSFSRKLRKLSVKASIGNVNYKLTFYTTCDYMAIGSDEDYLYIPLTPKAAQFLANKLVCTLPTKKIVDIIYQSAEIKLRPQPIPPTPAMTTMPVFKQHTDSIKNQIAQLGFNRSANYIIGGHKKDVIISNKIYSPDRSYDRVVIYGWHRAVNDPIQPVYNGHNANYADYSHGIRFILNNAFLNGDSIKITEILKNSKFANLLSDEGVITKPYYPAGTFTSVKNILMKPKIGFELFQNYPNPFNSSTIIDFQLFDDAPVNLSVFNVLGEKIETLISGIKPAGNYKIQWDASSYSSGVYFYILKSGNFRQSKKMALEE